MHRMKYLPWRSLFSVSAIATLLIIIIEFTIGVAYSHPAFQRTLNLLFSPPLGLLIPLAASVGLGAMAVYFIERFYPKLSINNGILWSLILCLIVLVFFKSLVFPAILIDADMIQLVGIVVGVFWKGRPYWRY